VHSPIFGKYVCPFSCLYVHFLYFLIHLYNPIFVFLFFRTFHNLVQTVFSSRYISYIFDFKYTLFSSIFIDADILSLIDGNTAILTPFTLAAESYIKNVSGRANCFLTETEPVESSDDPDGEVDHYMTLHLLPHQIIIFPKTIYSNMDASVLDEVRYYDDFQIRYNIYLTRKIVSINDPFFFCIGL